MLGEAPEPKTTKQPEPPLNLRRCDWAGDVTDPTKVALALSVVTTGGMQSGGAGGGNWTAQQQYDGIKALHPDATDVPGVGDAAFTTKTLSLDLDVLAGETVITVSAIYASQATPVTVDQLVALAKAAISRLP